jgi:phage I-like protein
MILNQAVDTREPPREWRIFKPGRNDTEYGAFYFTDASARSVMQAASEWGNDYSADFEHAAVKAAEEGREAPAAAWYRLETREEPDGVSLWAVDIRWTPRAEEMLKNAEYRYISPWFSHDEDRVILEYRNFALTNQPATVHMDALVAASKALDPRKAGRTEGSMSTDTTRLMAALGLRPDASEDAALGVVEDIMTNHRAHQQILSMIPEGQDAIGTVTAWRDRAERADELEATLAQRERDTATARVQQLLDQGVQDGKLTPASRDGLVAALKDDEGHVNPERVEAYLATVPKGAHVATHRQPVGTTDAPTSHPEVDADGKTEYERIVATDGHKALARMRLDDPDRFDQVLAAHRRARYGN